MRCPIDPPARLVPGTLNASAQTAHPVIHINPTQPDHISSAPAKVACNTKFAQPNLELFDFSVRTCLNFSVSDASNWIMKGVEDWGERGLGP